MALFRILAPLIVLALQILMKFAIGRRPERKHYFEQIIEVPTNLIFLTISFSLVFFTIQVPIGFDSILYCLGSILGSAIVVVIFKECKYLSESDSGQVKNKNAKLAFFIGFNYFICLVALYFYSINVMSLTNKQIEQASNKQEVVKVQSNISNSFDSTIKVVDSGKFQKALPQSVKVKSTTK